MRNPSSCAAVAAAGRLSRGQAIQYTQPPRGRAGLYDGTNHRHRAHAGGPRSGYSAAAEPPRLRKRAPVELSWYLRPLVHGSRCSRSCYRARVGSSVCCCRCCPGHAACRTPCAPPAPAAAAAAGGGALPAAAAARLCCVFVEQVAAINRTAAGLLCADGTCMQPSCCDATRAGEYIPAGPPRLRKPLFQLHSVHMAAAAHTRARQALEYRRARYTGHFCSQVVVFVAAPWLALKDPRCDEGALTSWRVQGLAATGAAIAPQAPSSDSWQCSCAPC
jgi:hypothetical protein